MEDLCKLIKVNRKHDKLYKIGYDNKRGKKMLDRTILINKLETQEDDLSWLGQTVSLARTAVPYLHKKIAESYIIIKKIYKNHAAKGLITNANRALFAKYQIDTLENTTIKKMNEELEMLKQLSMSNDMDKQNDAETILQIRVKELKKLQACGYASYAYEINRGYLALEKYFKEITSYMY